MLQKPRSRIFAGPNGSGKTHLFNYLKKEGIIHTELYVNADHIEKGSRAFGEFSFNAYRVKVSDTTFTDHIRSNGLYSKIRNSNFVDHISLKRGILKIDLSQTAISSYHASFIATYLCERLFETGRSFCYETVLSHTDKIKYIDLARTKGYRTYAYFIFTDNVEVNILRVKIGVLQGLHDVDEKKIRSRYKRTFRNIYQLMLRCDEGYLIGNSNEIEVIGELKNGQLTILKPLPSFLQIHLKGSL